MSQHPSHLPVYDPMTGQLIEHSQLRHYELEAYQPPQYPPPLQSLHPQHYPLPQPYLPQQPVWSTPPQELDRRESKARMAGAFFGMFVLSWIPCAVGLPGLTLLAWGLLAAYIFYRACR